LQHLQGLEDARRGGQRSGLISHDSSSVEDFLSSVPGLKFISADSATLLGSPWEVYRDAVSTWPSQQSTSLELMGERLYHLEYHDAIVLLRHSLAIPKLLHLL
jgi:hypothetical protein